MKSKNNGITLIALIITIIVMLILVSVTISMAINGGLFEYAGRAVSETENAIDREQALANGGIEVDGIQYNSIDDYIAGNPTPIHNWTREGDTFTCSHCDARYTMGQVVNYTPEGEKTGTNLTTAQSGYSSNQTIERQNATWIVLGIEDTDGNGTNETLLITTQAPVGKDEFNNRLYLRGAEAYNNGPSEINRICEELYSNSEYGKARGMTIEDVNSALNNPLEQMQLGGMYYNGSYQTTGNLTKKLRKIPTWNNIKANRNSTPNGANTEEALGEYILNGYHYYLNDDDTAVKNDANSYTAEITDIEKETIFGTSTDYVYWLASRGVSAGRNYANFGPGDVHGGRACSCSGTFSSDGGEDYGHGIAALRPVVSLKSKLPEKK